MIRYATLPDGEPITRESLRDAVNSDAKFHADDEIRAGLKDWLTKAEQRTAQLLEVKAFLELAKWKKLDVVTKASIPKPIAVDWSSVKHLFMAIQNEKCAY